MKKLDLGQGIANVGAISDVFLRGGESCSSVGVVLPRFRRRLIVWDLNGSW